jgi:hypothetical protein
MPARFDQVWMWVVERGRAQFPHEMIDVPIQLLRDQFECVDRRPQVASIAAHRLERRNAVVERGQLLAELIVHLAGNPAPLVFLGEYQTGDQLGPRTVGAFPLTDFGA